MSVKRISFKQVPQMHNAYVEFWEADGRYVLYTDYTTLEARLAEVEAENAALKAGQAWKAASERPLNVPLLCWDGHRHTICTDFSVEGNLFGATHYLLLPAPPKKEG